MRRSVERVLTTHVGSFARPTALADMLARREDGERVDDAELDGAVGTSLANVVDEQLRVGLDVINDGEQSKYSYATYARGRLTGFERAPAGADGSPQAAIAEAQDFPAYFAPRYQQRSAVNQTLYWCTGPIAYQGRAALERDIANLKATVPPGADVELFMTAVSPGLIRRIENRYYPSQDEYELALAEALGEEYRAIVDAGLVLQIDCPDLGTYRRIHDVSLEEARRVMARTVELINHATRDIDPQSMRMHVCCGADESPHHRDLQLAEAIDLLLSARPAGLLVVAANGRHEHEWRVFEDVELPDGKVLIPGVIDNSSNIIEHPEVVAERIRRYVSLLGQENVIAGVDCGFSVFATTYAVQVDPQIVWAKLSSLVEGARLASSR